MYRQEATESRSISFPGRYLSLLDAFATKIGKERTYFAVRGSRKQIIYEMRFGGILRILRKITGKTISLDVTERVEMEIPKDLLCLYRSHVEDCGYSLDMMVMVGLTKFMLCKDDPAEFWSELEKELEHITSVIN